MESGAQLRKLFSPASITVFGVTDEEGSISTPCLQGSCWSVSKSRSSDHSNLPERARPQLFTSLADGAGSTGHSVDLAAIIAPAAEVPPIIRGPCGLAGVRAVVLFSGRIPGFRIERCADQTGDARWRGSVTYCGLSVRVRSG
ncbi:MAG: hypothetical protein IPN64_12120 [Propionivibrio sp.]|uniref:hypothetical protein n=1 Tax=Propionivibrio sp. TaxID=2212460 RepID=UPI0025EA3F16|nr:hypothetical protein [Propionivibrio sp.]MBK8894758.1 hypothetical protein [Propionivibrio sp.]